MNLLEEAKKISPIMAEDEELVIAFLFGQISLVQLESVKKKKGTGGYSYIVSVVKQMIREGKLQLNKEGDKE